MNSKMQITLSEPMMNSLRQEASELEITPNVLARIQLCQVNGYSKPDAPYKSYIVKVKNWREIEEYAGEKGYSLEAFLNKAAEWYMRKFSLTKAQKAALERRSKNEEKP